ncbi:MAG: transcriptional repressor [Candidatus Accumulibacter sp.]|jgi:Fur family zinc uptake transcriptional regulator|nr:transcriptional repressor [Accumulibacter sp.]
MSAKTPAKAIAQGMIAAECLCARHGVRLTNLRRAILEILLAAGAPVKAYDILEMMRDRGQRITPATVYRTLEFLLQNGLIHRVNALNAYISCTCRHDDNTLLMFICSECQAIKEIDDHDLYDYMQKRLEKSGLSLRDGCIEMQGTCRECMR